MARTGGLAEIVGGTQAGLLFEPGNPEALAECIAQVFADDGLAQQMRERAAALLAAKYSWDAIAARTLMVYRAAKA